MSICKCAICDKIYDTDFQMEVDEDGDCICDNCYEEMNQREQDEGDMPGGFASVSDNAY
jgi:hypothetical protein